MATEYDVWRRQFEELADVLRPHAFEIDGSLFLDVDAPTDISRVYRRMVQVGYARGWL